MFQSLLDAESRQFALVLAHKFLDGLFVRFGILPERPADRLADEELFLVSSGQAEAEEEGLVSARLPREL